MKNSYSSLKDKFVTREILDNKDIYETKSTNINVLLNRVKLGQKKESRRKLLFIVFTSISLVLFGSLIF